MMHPIEQYLEQAGRKLLAIRVARAATITALVVFGYLSLYFAGILLIKSMSLTWGGLLTVPFLALLALAVAIPYFWWTLRNHRRVARFLEERHPDLQLSVRSSLDFLAGRVDQDQPRFQQAYVTQVAGRLRNLDVREPSRRPWLRFALLAMTVNALIWFLFQGALMDKFYNPALSFGQTHLDLNKGSITIFEPDYTQVPGRTLPLKAGTFSAYPGSKVRFMVQLPKGTRSLYLTRDGADAPVPLTISDELTTAYEFVLMENTELQFLLSDSLSSGRSSPFRFEIKTDEIPEIQLRGHTPEGALNTMDPLIIEAEIRDDFGVKELVAVVSWEGGEKRLPINVPQARKKHFLTKNQWYLSDFELEDVATFSVYLEATDNNPITGPGVGRSQTLTYELESPEKKYDEFMDQAKELLDTMTHVLGDNLETVFANQLQISNLQRAEGLGQDISGGLYRSLNLTNNLISKVRDTPNLTRLDQNFLYTFRNGVSKQARARSEMGLLYSNIRLRRQDASYRQLVSQHRREEVTVEDLTYELLLQLKQWAIFELERQKEKMSQDLDSMEDLLNNSQNMDEEKLMEMFNKLMDEVMQDFEQMMANAAKQMDMSMSEFMNSDAMQSASEQLQDLREQIMEALKAGDMEKARALMEELKAQMQAAAQSMQEQIGEMSPEMMAMMENMRELMGLLNELKSQEEGLEASTNKLKRELDEAMGGNPGEMDEAKQAEYRKATEKIHELLTNLYNRLVEYTTEDLSSNILKEMAKNKEKLADESLGQEEREQLAADIDRQERLLDYLARDGMDKLQEVTLRNLDQTEKLQEYLDQGELLLSLESAAKLESLLVLGERESERSASRKVREETNPKETFREARQELYKLLDALQNMKQNMEDKRRRYMEANKEERQKQLAQRQAAIEKMIEEFKQRTEDTFGGSQIAQHLEDIARDMQNAESKLDGSRLEGGIQYEQQALQKIGEMMEQLQQARKPGGRPNFMSSRQTGNYGDPSLEDIFIPESEKKATRDRMRDEIRKRLQKNLPDSYGKEIRKYYESLMDQ